MANLAALLALVGGSSLGVAGGTRGGVLKTRRKVAAVRPFDRALVARNKTQRGGKSKSSERKEEPEAAR